jgi:hypothetical protein
MLQPPVFRMGLTRTLISMLLCLLKNLFETMIQFPTKTHINIIKYSIVAPIAIKNVKNAVRILNTKLIGNKIFLISIS